MSGCTVYNAVRRLENDISLAGNQFAVVHNSLFGIVRGLNYLRYLYLDVDPDGRILADIEASVHTVRGCSRYVGNTLRKLEDCLIDAGLMKGTEDIKESFSRYASHRMEVIRERERSGVGGREYTRPEEARGILMGFILSFAYTCPTFTREEVIDARGLNPAKANQCLKELVERGDLVCTLSDGKFIYSLPDRGDSKEA